MDYASPHSWQELAELLRTRFIPAAADECNHVECELGWSWDPVLPDYDAWLVIAGRGRGRVGDEAWALGPGSLVVLRPGDVGSFRQDPADRLIVVSCHFDFVAPGGTERVAVPSEWLPSRHIPVPNPAQLIDSMLRMVRMGRDPHPLRRAERSGWFVSVLAEIYRQDARAAGSPVDVLDQRVQEVIDHVRSQLSHRPTLAEAATIAGLSPAHLSRLFSQQLGMSFRQFVLEARLDRARHLLTETGMSVGEVARALGYQDVFLFSRQIRDRFGQPPSRLRG